MVVSPLVRGPGNIHGFDLDGKSYGKVKATAQTPTVTTVSAVRITMLRSLLALCLNNNKSSNDLTIAPMHLYEVNKPQ